MVVFVMTHDDSRRDRLTTALRERGYKAVVAPHREEVHAFIQEKQPQVVVLDMYMSDPSGLQTLDRIRREGYRGKVVILGGSSIRSTVGQAVRVGVDQLVGEVPAVDGQLDLDQIDAAIRSCFHDAIARRAHELWEAKGKPQGQDREQWTMAEREILALTPSSSAP